MPCYWDLAAISLVCMQAGVCNPLHTERCLQAETIAKVLTAMQPLCQLPAGGAAVQAVPGPSEPLAQGRRLTLLLASLASHASRLALPTQVADASIHAAIKYAPRLWVRGMAAPLTLGPCRAMRSPPACIAIRAEACSA